MMSARKLFRLLVLALGLFYVVLAIWGFASISDNSNVGGNLRGGNPPELLWDLFSVNTVLNFIHFLLGAVTIASGVVYDRSKMGVWTVSVGFVLLFAYDVVQMFIQTGTDPLAINGADAWLHGLTLLLLVVLSFVPMARPRPVSRESRVVPSPESHPR